MNIWRQKKTRRIVIAALVFLGVLAGTLAGLATFWTEYAWFAHMNFAGVFITTLSAKVVTGALFGLIAFAFFVMHIELIRRLSRPRQSWNIPTPEGEIIDIKEIVAKFSTPIVVSAALAVSAFMGYWASLHWEDALRYINQTPFDQRDPVLNKDVGYYLFELPIMQFAQQWLVYLTGLSAVLSAVVYVGRDAIDTETRIPTMSAQVRGHLLFSLALTVLAVAWGFRVEMFEILFSKRGIAYGATYSDVNANLIAYRIMIAAAILCAIFLIGSIRIGPTRGPASILRPGYALIALGLLHVVTVIGWPTVVQRVVVNPNELERERPYLANAIAGTQAAYGLDRIEVKEFPATEALDLKQLENNRATVDNIKLWDHEPLRETYRQLQVIRLYYDFPNVSIDRYRIGDNYWQVMLSAREMVHGQLPPQSQTWVNRHLLYTHGYGACLSPVNKSTGEGLPDLWVKDIPPNARHKDIRITRPEIYYGLESDDYVLVKTTTQEFDYPQGKDNVYATYHGTGGVGVGSFSRRLLFALRFGDANLLFTKHLTAESKILFNRTIARRVATVAPFLMLDQQPYITVVDGRMYWIQDAYTVSYRYPYSTPTPLGRRRRINYIRNSVKVVVDAYDGSMRFFVWDENDPLIATYRKIYPSLFLKRSQMPTALAAHVRYPKDLFTIQAAMYESFHMTDPRVFYNQEDKWSIARQFNADGPADSATAQVPRRRRRGRTPASAAEVTNVPSRMSAYYMIMRLPDIESEEFLLMLPFTPSNKDNMVAWMTARCDTDHYGKVLIYTFPKNKLIYGPMQVQARIDQDDYISQWITLRNQQGSSVVRGDLLVIPIEESILYVEPVYLQSTQTRLPELRQVIVAFGQKVAMKPTLKAALAAVFGVNTAKPEARSLSASGLPRRPSAANIGAADANVPALVKDALEHYRRSQERIASADWAAYGKEQQALERKLKSIADALKGRLKPPSSNAGELPSAGEKEASTPPQP